MTKIAELVLDKALILDRLGGDEELFAEMSAIFVADAESYCAALGTALESGVALEVQREAHTVKGLLATFADDAGTDMAMAVEHQAREGQLDGLAAPVAALQERVRLLAQVLVAGRAA